MTEWVFIAKRVYEGRVTDKKVAWNLETAKELARNWMERTEPPTWEKVEEQLHWEVQNPEYDTDYIIDKTILYGYPEDEQ